ncbi:YgaP family membrane protein [Arcticibacter tournemirensis]
MRERIIRAVAGSLVLISALLAFTVNINWLWLAVFVGFNLLQSSVTGFCPLEKILILLKAPSYPTNVPEELKN